MVAGAAGVVSFAVIEAQDDGGKTDAVEGEGTGLSSC
jgi:hypothetical protein